MTDKKEKALTDKYEKEALWFYDGMQGITEQSFNNEFDGATDNKVLNELLRERTAFLDKLIEFSSRHDEHEKLRKHKQGKMKLFKKVLLRSDFVGEKTQEKSTLRKAVENLYEDFGEKGSIKGFRENLLTTWQRQWEEGKDKEEPREKLLTSWRIINGILQLCQELEMKDLCKRYGKEALSFGDRLLEIRRSDMKNVEIKRLLNELKEVATSIGDRKRKNEYRDALQVRMFIIQALTPQVLRAEKKPSPEQTPKSGSEEEEEFEADEDIEAISSGATLVEVSEAVATEVSGEVLEAVSEEEVEVGSEEDTEVEGGYVAVFEKKETRTHTHQLLAGAVEPPTPVTLGTEERGNKIHKKLQIFNATINRQGSQHLLKESGTVTSEGTNWAVKQGGVLLMFPRDAVSEPTPLVVHRWKYSACSPHLQEHEAITSNVIELSSISGQGQKFSTKVKLSLSHSAPDLPGYELVIKRLIDKENNEWEDLDGTRNVRCRQEIEDAYPSHIEIPSVYFPLAQADITEYSTYAVVCRLKASPTYIITSKGGSFSHPDHPGVIVTIPENAVAPNAKCPLELKVQEVSNKEFVRENVFLGPVLRNSAKKPLCTCKAFVLPIQTSSELVFDFLVTVAVFNLYQHSATNLFYYYFRYFPFLVLRKAYSSIAELTLRIFYQPKQADFVAYFREDFPDILSLICCPSHLTGQVIGDLEEKEITPIYGSSDTDMIPGHDRAFVHVSEGISPFNEKDMKDLYLMLRDEQPFKKDLRVRLFKNKDPAQVEFCRTLEQTGRTPLCKLHLKIPTQSTDHTVSFCASHLGLRNLNRFGLLSSNGNTFSCVFNYFTGCIMLMPFNVSLLTSPIMASSMAEGSSELNQLFRDISSKFSPAESEDVVKSSKRIYGEQFKSLGNQDLLSCLDRLCKFGYISSKKLTLIKEFIGTRSNNEHDINKRVEDFEISRPSQPEPEKELHGRIEDTVVGRIHDLLKVTSEGPSVLLLLDNVDQFTEGKGKEGENLRTQFLYFLGKLSEFDGEKGSLHVLLTSRTQLNNSEKVSNFKLQPLTNNFSEKILLPTETFHFEAQEKKKLLDICKGVPLLLKGTAAILKQRRKSPSDLIHEIEMNSKEEAGVPVKSKHEEDTEERPFNSEEEGIDDEQMSVIREMFYTLPSDILRVSAVSISLFHGPFTASTAAKILGVSMSEAVAHLEGLVTNEIIHVIDEDAKQ
ncbi:unnamed protein product [Porites evermanni]|uniref:ZU5 domain-containing protein n=1 Tax=Porites evermanni TaxID=104178 RepID=A0ABN8SG00_9CNID|nr:unnamed protein product [Porites evermanni]